MSATLDTKRSYSTLDNTEAPHLPGEQAPPCLGHRHLGRKRFTAHDEIAPKQFKGMDGKMDIRTLRTQPSHETGGTARRSDSRGVDNRNALNTCLNVRQNQQHKSGQRSSIR